MNKEKIIQLYSCLETDTQKTLFLVLTDEGNIFKSYDLELWDITNLPDFNDKELKLKKSKLNG